MMLRLLMLPLLRTAGGSFRSERRAAGDGYAGWGGGSRRRDCHSAAPPSPFSTCSCRCINMDGDRGRVVASVSKMTVSPTTRWRRLPMLGPQAL